MININNFLTSHNNRIVGLDIIRTIAILLVVYAHGVLLIPMEYRNLYLSLDIIKIDGVSIFFVLSGFLIGGILLKTISNSVFGFKDVINFWIRRWFRTIPNYLFVLLAIICFRLLISFSLQDFNIRYLFFLQNFEVKMPEFFPESWSLSVEEWFYLLFPLSCYGFYKTLKSKSKSVLLSAIIFIIVPLILRSLRYENGITSEEFDSVLRKIVLFRLDSLMYGIIGSYLFAEYYYFWCKFKFHLLTIGILLILFLNIAPQNISHFYLPLYFNIESIIAFCFLPYVSTIKTTKNSYFDAIFIFISLISYSMYLLNLTPIIVHAIPTLGIFLNAAGIQSSSLICFNYFTYWVLTIGGSYLLYRFYESPITKLRDKIKI